MKARMISWPRAAGALLAVGAWLTMAMPASAAINFELGNHPQKPAEKNVNYNTSTGTTVTGTLVPTPSSGINVDFTSTTTLSANGGQESLRNIVPNLGLNNVTISMAPTNPVTALGYTCLIINPSLSNLLTVTAATQATITVSAVDKNGVAEPPAPFTLPLGNGQNFLTITTANGEVITSTSITTPSGTFFFDLGQVRLCPAAVPSAVIPEPASIVIWGLMAALGLLFWHRRGRR